MSASGLIGLDERDPFNQNSDRSDGKKRTKGGPVFSKLFRLDRTDPLSFGPKFPEILVEWIAPDGSAFPIILQETSGCAPTKELCQNPILYLRQVFDVYNFVLLEGTRWFFHHPTSNLLKVTKPSWIEKNYACATRFNLRVVVSCLHDTVTKSRTRVQFSPRCEHGVNPSWGD